MAFTPNPRYPDPAIEILDERFLKLRLFSASVERIATGLRWAEGPVWFGDGRYLLWSDIPNNRILKWEEETGAVSIWRKPTNFGNGNTRDRQGRLVTCEHGRRVTRTEYDGSITVLMDRWQGKRLNSPNDVAVKADGTVWFTDPPYGILTDLEGWRGELEYGACNVFRLDPASGELRVAADDFAKPNGIAFSPDEKTLYVADTGFTHDPAAPRHIRAFDVTEDGKLRNSRVFATCDVGLFDGFRCDTEGRVWTSAGDGVHCYAPGGDLLGKILVPEVVANVCFGGVKKNRLYICGTTSLYAVLTHVNGAQRP
jgi:gluconolactonase